MVKVSSSGGARFRIEVHHNFGNRNEDMVEYLDGLDNKIRTTVIKKMVAAAGRELAKEIRKQLKTLDMPYSRARNAAERRKARQSGTKPLVRTIRTKVWSRPQKGIIGAVVGPSSPEGSHGHWVEFGHRITGKARVKLLGLSIKALRRGRIRSKVYRVGRKQIARSGDRTVAHHFQQSAMDRAAYNIREGMAAAMFKALRRLDNPHIKNRIIRAHRFGEKPF